MKNDFYQQLDQQLEELKQEGLYKTERVITSDQAAQHRRRVDRQRLSRRGKACTSNVQVHPW